MFIKTICTIAVMVTFFSCITSTGDNHTGENHAKFMLVLGAHSQDQILCVAEFYRDTSEVFPKPLDKGTKVLLDGSGLELSSEDYQAYTMERSGSEFGGKHKWTVVFSNGERKEYELQITPIVIKSKIPDVVGNDDIIVKCENLKSTDIIFLNLSGNFSEMSEDDLSISPNDGYFIIPKSFWKDIDTITCRMNFNIYRSEKISSDDYFKHGVKLEWSIITGVQEIKVMH